MTLKKMQKKIAMGVRHSPANLFNQHEDKLLQPVFKLLPL
jgi:hypothetical protein